MLTKVFLAGAFTAASAQVPDLAKRDILEGRQELDAQCQSALTQVAPLYSDLPTPPPALLTMSLPSDPCATPTLTGDAASQFSSYTSEALVWYSSHSAELSSALDSCSELASYAASVPVCSAAVNATATMTSAGSISATSSSSGDAPATSDTTGGPSSPTTAVPVNAAPRETGLVGMVAIAAAGFIGVVATL
ncbi:hypothetical protein F4779DRAFT_234342 [Xylariaceae sp. FL0662B]|nr:hypothetical protein F4779DRAFT_234342 [Xylariaceae sp. FL0662B]